jgi:hypothetical protein
LWIRSLVTSGCGRVPRRRGSDSSRGTCRRLGRVPLQRPSDIRGPVNEASLLNVGFPERKRILESYENDPLDDRFYAPEKDGSLRRAPGHISWNVWIDGAWRQMTIIQGEGLEYSEVPPREWTGSTHPGRIRFQTFRPRHSEPLTDAVLGQGMMSIGGGGYGGGALPYPSEVLQLWGGEMRQAAIPTPAAPTVVKDDGSGGASVCDHCRWRSGSSDAGLAPSQSRRAGDASPGQRRRRRFLCRPAGWPGGDQPIADRGLTEGMDRCGRAVNPTGGGGAPVARGGCFAS